MKEEIWRAGYNADAGQSLKLSGASNTIYTQQVSADEAYLGFVYLQNSASSAYRNIVYQFKDNKLNYCLGNLQIFWLSMKSHSAIQAEM